MTTTVQPGSISHGTMLECDLIPTFLDALTEHAPEAAAKIVDEFGQGFIDRCSDPRGLDYSLTNEMDNQGWLLEALFDALDACSPEGYYFGAHPGDGADYGWWESDADEW